MELSNKHIGVLVSTVSSQLQWSLHVPTLSVCIEASTHSPYKRTSD